MQLILLSAGRGSRLSKELRSKPKSESSKRPTHTQKLKDQINELIRQVEQIKDVNAFSQNQRLDNLALIGRLREKIEEIQKIYNKS